MKKLLLVLSFVAVASLSFAQSTNAMGRSNGNANFPISFSKHVQKFAYNIQTELDISEPAGFNTTDGPNTVLCPGTSGKCLIQADEWIQVGEGSLTFNRAAICFLVDGNLVDNCYFAGEVPADGSFVQVSTSHGIVVPFGNHTVATQLYTDDGGFVAFINSTYRVYKP